jgi:GT2 family glycosyltransferase
MRDLDRLPQPPQQDAIALDVLVPTYGRPAALAVTLSGLAAQEGTSFRVVVSSQDEEAAWPPEVLAVAGILRGLGRPVDLVRHLPRRGVAEHRQSLLDRATAPFVLFLDDDVWLAPGTLARLHATIRRERCGFVGMAPIGWSYLDDHRPHDHVVEPWDRPVEPEVVTPGDASWERHRLHSAANMVHAAAALGLGPGDALPYRVAWVGGCVLYDTAALREAGGFAFWEELPIEHAGEDALAELRVMRSRGGCAILPSGAWHLELPTTVPRRDVDAPLVLRV